MNAKVYIESNSAKRSQHSGDYEVVSTHHALKALEIQEKEHAWHDLKEMSKEEIIQECLSEIDGFEGSDSEYLDLLYELIDECKIRIEGKEMELE